jgi:hypothetical protein
MGQALHFTSTKSGIIMVLICIKDWAWDHG